MNTQATVSNTGNPIIAPLLHAVYILIAVVVLAGASLFFRARPDGPQMALATRAFQHQFSRDDLRCGVGGRYHSHL